MKSMTPVRLYSERFNYLNATCTLAIPVSYAVSELQKDVERELQALPESEREAARTKFAVFVVHNKLKPKIKDLPADIPVRTFCIFLWALMTSIASILFSTMLVLRSKTCGGYLSRPTLFHDYSTHPLLHTGSITHGKVGA